MPRAGGVVDDVLAREMDLFVRMCPGGIGYPFHGSKNEVNFLDAVERVENIVIRQMNSVVISRRGGEDSVLKGGLVFHIEEGWRWNI